MLLHRAAHVVEQHLTTPNRRRRKAADDMQHGSGLRRGSSELKMVLRPELPSPSPAKPRGASTAHATAPPQEPAEAAEATGAAGAGECQGAGGWPLVRRRFSCQHSLRRFSLQSKQGSGGSTQGEGRTATRGSLTSAAGDLRANLASFLAAKGAHNRRQTQAPPQAYPKPSL